MKKFAAMGAVYGTGLAVLAFLAAGAGHGTYVVLGLASAPLGIFGILVALVGLPLLWAAIFALAVRNKNGFASAMLLHYLSAAALVTNHKFADSFGDWGYFARMWATSRAFLVGCFIWYLAGQLFLWLSFFTTVFNWQARPHQYRK